MNHASIGYIDEQCRLHISEDILSPLSIIKDVMAWGMLYPRRQDRTPSPYKNIEYDFVVSPIPFELWGKVGRIKVRLHNTGDSLKSIAKAIYDLNGSILLSEANRSAHSYDTWTIAVAFDDVVNDSNDYEPNKMFYKQTDKQFKKLEQYLINECRDNIYFDDINENYKNGLRVSSYNALHYFHHYKSLSKNIEHPIFSWAAHKVFKLKANNQGMLMSMPGDQCFKSIISKICDNTKSKLPLNIIVSLETNDINFRMALITEERRKYFFKMSTLFEKSGPNPPLTQGFSYHVLNKISEYYKVWNMVDRTMSFLDDHESGRIDFILESNSEKVINQEEFIKNILIPKTPNDLQDICIQSVKCKSLNIDYLKNNTESGTNKKYDFFISYCRFDSEYAELLETKMKDQGLECFRDVSRLTPGCEFGLEIRKAILSSHSFAVICTANAIKSDWVKRELSGMWFLPQKLVIPILCDGFKARELPMELRGKQACELAFIDKYLESYRYSVDE